MSIFKTVSRISLLAVVLSLIVSCSEPSVSSTNATSNKFHLTVYKNANCKCCSKWIGHIREQGFATTSENESRSSLFDLKTKHGVPSGLSSCHTSMSDEGFVFEGHIPAKFIRQFINEKPADALGLSVPSMPTGTPGMEFGDRFQPYKVFLLKTDGTTEVYVEVNAVEEQF